MKGILTALFGLIIVLGVSALILHVTHVFRLTTPKSSETEPDYVDTPIDDDGNTISLYSLIYNEETKRVKEFKRELAQARLNKLMKET